MATPNRYLLEPLTGLEGHAAAKHWGPAAEPSPEVEQGWLPFSDGSQLGPRSMPASSTRARRRDGRPEGLPDGEGCVKCLDLWRDSW